MPVYNAEKYLGETLQSLLKQTYKDFEILCINDASIDTTSEILKNFQCMDKRIRILENNEHSGAALSRNVGIREAKGKYITFWERDLVQNYKESYFIHRGNYRVYSILEKETL